MAVIDRTGKAGGHGTGDRARFLRVATTRPIVIDLTHEHAEDGGNTKAPQPRHTSKKVLGRCVIDLTGSTLRLTKMDLLNEKEPWKRRQSKTGKKRKTASQKSLHRTRTHSEAEEAHRCKKKKDQQHRHSSQRKVGNLLRSKQTESEDDSRWCSPPLIRRKIPAWAPGRPWPPGGYKNISFLTSEAPPHNAWSA